MGEEIGLLSHGHLAARECMRKAETGMGHGNIRHEKAGWKKVPEKEGQARSLACLDILFTGGIR